MARVGMILMCMLAAGCLDPRSSLDQLSAPFPKGIEFRRVVAEASEFAIREGCLAAVLEISDQSLSMQEGRLRLSALGAIGRDGEVLEPWAPGPLPVAPHPLNPGREQWVTSSGETRYVDVMNCYGAPERGPQSLDVEIRSLHAELQEGRAYFTTYNGGEGLLVIAPSTGRSGHFYNG